jgi:murein DD-endopeptidase MepM/ murein hydrolase activator NlpD
VRKRIVAAFAVVMLVSTFSAVPITTAKDMKPPNVVSFVDPAYEMFDTVRDKFRSPLAAWEITSPFGIRLDPFGGGTTEFHKGVDLVQSGERVVIRAMADGVVIDNWLPPGEYYDGWHSGHPVYGGCIVIAHENGIHTLYGHISKTFVHEGWKVKKGDIIAIMGDTGFATGVHLHLGVFIRTQSDTGPYDVYYDPMQTLLKKEAL